MKARFSDGIWSNLFYNMIVQWNVDYPNISHLKHKLTVKNTSCPFSGSYFGHFFFLLQKRLRSDYHVEAN